MGKLQNFAIKSLFAQCPYVYLPPSPSKHGQNQLSGKFCKFTHVKVKCRKWETSLYSECDCVSSIVTGLVKSVIDNSSES